MQRNKNKTNNQLWVARKRLGLRQKHVAYLLNHKTTDQVSRYEQGLRLPGIKLFLQFEIIYGMPVRFLYRDLYDELQKELDVRAHSLKLLGDALPVSAGAGLFTAFCSHEELLRNPHPSQEELDQVRKHQITIQRRMNELI